MELLVFIQGRELLSELGRSGESMAHKTNSQVANFSQDAWRSEYVDNV